MAAHGGGEARGLGGDQVDAVALFHRPGGADETTSFDPADAAQAHPPGVVGPGAYIPRHPVATHL